MHPEEIKAALRIKGMTQAMLADELQVAPSSVNQAITGHIKSERIQARISQIIGKPIKVIWPNQITLRRTRAQIEQARGRSMTAITGKQLIAALAAMLAQAERAIKVEGAKQ